jgi:16S rRNA G966 N2-methylase RsmD
MSRWNNFYQNIRDPSWPECASEHEFAKLPEHIQHEILNDFGGSEYLYLTKQDLYHLPLTLPADDLCSNQDYDLQFSVANDFVVYYNHSIEGGGIDVGQNFPRIIRCLYPNRTFEHGMEWAAGHGAIGFRLLADCICKNMHLVESHQSAINACEKTISNMPTRFCGAVSVSHTSTLETLDHRLKFDLIVANPPAYSTCLWNPDNFENAPVLDWHRISVDKNWQAHQDFFANVKKHLAPGGVVLLQEQKFGSSVFEFEKFIADSGLKIVSAFSEKSNQYTWYLELTH